MRGKKWEFRNKRGRKDKTKKCGKKMWNMMGKRNGKLVQERHQRKKAKQQPTGEK